MVIVDDEEEKNRKACGEAVLAVMEKTREKKKRYGGILAFIDKHLSTTTF